MSGYRKLNRPSDQRRALLRNQVTALLWNGKIETTQARAKEVRAIAEKLITLAVKEYDHTLTVTKDVNNEKGQTVPTEFKIDAPSKLHARRQIMSYLYDVKEAKQVGESKSDYKDRTKDIRHPLVEKMFNEMGPKYAKRNEETQQGGGYVRMLKKGPRRGDAAEMVILELL